MDDILKNRLLERKYDYTEIYNHSGTIINVSKEKRDINFIVGIKGRTSYFRATIKNIVSAINATKKIKVKLIVVEQDNEAVNKDFCDNLKVDYIFLPQEICKSENYHSTALMYNVGYLFNVEAKYNMFHCADTLIGYHFFDTLAEHYLNKNFNWIQPYCEKRVVTFSSSSTNAILRGLGDGMDPSEFGPEYFNKEPEQSGAPGGSILVPTKLMDSVGGYDPELFYGYTVEDSFFWGKLEAVSTGERCSDIHFRGATYAENPKLYLYHLNHPSAQNSNHKFEHMFNYYVLFFRKITYTAQKEYINLKSELFKKEKEKIWTDIKELKA